MQAREVVVKFLGGEGGGMLLMSVGRHRLGGQGPEWGWGSLVAVGPSACIHRQPPHLPTLDPISRPKS